MFITNRRLSQPIPALAALALLAICPVYGAQIDLAPITQGFQSFDGTTFEATSNFQTGTAANEDIADARFVLQFNLSSLPAGAVITDAELFLRSGSPDLAGTTTVRGFTGNGAFTAANLTAGTDLFSFSTDSASPLAHNVTSFIQSEAGGAAVWAGFSARQSPLGSCSNSAAQADGFCLANWNSIQNSPAPHLTITFSATTAAAPEPSSMAMLLAGSALLGHRVLRKRRLAVTNR